MEETKLPGLLLAVLGGMSILISLLEMGVGGASFAVAQLQEFLGALGGGLSGGAGIINLIVGVVILLGGLKMRNAENYNLAMAASVLAVLPMCTLMCCSLGVPIGIWCIITLRKDEVKNNFR